MFGLLFLFFVLKSFYSLASDHERNKWLYALYSLLVFYGTAFLTSTIIYGSIFLYGEEPSSATEKAISYLALVVAIGLMVWWYNYLERRWKRLESIVADYGQSEELLDDIEI